MRIDLRMTCHSNEKPYSGHAWQGGIEFSRRFATNLIYWVKGGPQ